MPTTERDTLIEPKNKLFNPRPIRYEVWPTLTGYALVDNEVVDGLGGIEYFTNPPPGPWVLARSTDVDTLIGLAQTLNQMIDRQANHDYWYGPIESGELQKVIGPALEPFLSREQTVELRHEVSAVISDTFQTFYEQTGIKCNWMMLRGIEHLLPECMKLKTKKPEQLTNE